MANDKVYIYDEDNIRIQVFEEPQPNLIKIFETGPQGPKGEQGPTGPQGPAGDVVGWLNALPAYSSDAEAIAAGKIAGEWYKSSAGHLEVRAGIPIQIQ